MAMAREGQCPFCTGATTVDLRLDEIETDHLIEIACDTCTFLVGVAPLPALVFDERVAGALDDVGIDPERYDWELPTPTTRVASRDPVRIEFDVSGDGTAITIVVDEGFGVRSVDTGQ
ncbi:hypothetical protein NDI89_07670 [Natrinema sp. S1CR25-10]|uniref:DUF7351 domain-containing protein n=2 Tax=Natrinema salsiterrestre TaxID=2950540 RepID=A0A9Q4L012_9EURY|nr:hypothetical protein [Natrinema salsiterrestre]MDF9745461.1 hypothetical protein [Natrinema salsiterrestre]